jgi:small GTP-binding protein
MLFGEHSIQGDPDLLFKVILVGDSGVGKTALVTRFLNHTFLESSAGTVGVEFRTGVMEIDGRVVKIQIWDTAGQERYRSLITSYYRGTACAFIVYDVTYSLSFSSVMRWLDEVRLYCPPDCAASVIGNKTDLEDERAVFTEQGVKFAATCGLSFLETSAKASENVAQAFANAISIRIARVAQPSRTSGAAEHRAGVAVLSEFTDERRCCSRQ